MKAIQAMKAVAAKALAMMMGHESRHAGGQPPRTEQPGTAGFAFALVLAAMLAAPGGLSCRRGTEPEPAGITLRLDAVPVLLKADSVSTATIWATVLDEGRPVADSTAVYFAATLGMITAEAYTRDGLARAMFSDAREPGVAAIVAQVLGVRDTVLVTVY